MLIWSKQNEMQLERLEQLIEIAGTQTGTEMELALFEIREILKNDTLDVDRKMDEWRVPLLITACKWCSSECMMILLDYGADKSVSFQLERLMGLDFEITSDAKTGEELLMEYKKDYLEIIMSDEYTKNAKLEIQLLLNQVEECLALLKSKNS